MTENGAILRWPGSKHKARQLLHGLAPMDGYAELREPFFGSGSTIRELPANKRAWLIDKNAFLMTFWFGIRGLDGDPDLDIEEVMHLKWTMRTERQKRERFAQARARVRSGVLLPIDFFVLDRFATSAIVSQGRPDIASFSSCYKRDGFDAVKRTKLIFYREILRRPHVRLECGDYAAAIEAPGTDVWLVLDPPYRMQHPASPIYQYYFTKQQHIELCERLRACQHLWLMTIHNSALIRWMYRGYTIRIHRYTGSMHRAYDRWKTELFISNY